MPVDITMIAVLIILFVSTLVRAVFGFANALIAMPLLAMTAIGMKTATPLVALVATILSLAILVKDWRIIDLKCTWRLLIGTLPGIPLGLLLLKGPYENTGKIILSLVIMGFSLYTLFRPKLFSLKREWAAYPFGFLAGILGGAYNSNGPPIVIYGTLRKWPPDCFRANLQGYFFPANLIIIFSHGLGGLWTPTVGSVFSSLSAGRSAFDVDRKPPQSNDSSKYFERYIHMLLILVGALLFIRTVWA